MSERPRKQDFAQTNYDNGVLQWVGSYSIAQDKYIDELEKIVKAKHPYLFIESVNQIGILEQQVKELEEELEKLKKRERQTLAWMEELAAKLDNLLTK